MSDFDKEAEREKLREKYERDQAEREATQRMSDLLLKGATMTNTHCGTCGDPLFKQEGTTFCPSCHGNPDAIEGTERAVQQSDEPEEGADSATEANPAQSTSEMRDPNDGEPASDAGSPQSPERAGQGGESASAGSASGSPSEDVRSRAPNARPSRTTENEDERHGVRRLEPNSSRADDHDGRTPSTGPVHDLEGARASLVAALEKFSRKAAETDDPRHATECLKAAREAGETLETLR
jgi:uncharacterized Zn finger protein (UPF0148 family)